MAARPQSIRDLQAEKMAYDWTYYLVSSKEPIKHLDKQTIHWRVDFLCATIACMDSMIQAGFRRGISVGPFSID